jgi:glycosyltransferase involved in cell wall biosynthesis
VTADRVSVLMTARDRERYIGSAIDSILQQSQTPYEVVVVDDGSRDGTLRELERFGDAIRVLRQPPRGNAAGLNRAIAASSGHLLAFLDSDDLWTDHSLACRLDRLAEDDQPDGVYGRIEQFVSPELDPRRFRFDPSPPPTPLFDALLIGRSVADALGPLDEGLSTASNIDWLARGRAAGVRLVAIDALVARRRIHGTNMGLMLGDATRDDLLRLVRAHRHRMRGGSSPA